MAKKSVLGAWAFLIGVILAVIIGLFGLTASWTIPLLLILGILVGLLNVGGSEAKDFMLAGVVLIIASALGGQMLLNLSVSIFDIGAVLQALVTLFVPATIIVALRSVFSAAKR